MMIFAQGLFLAMLPLLMSAAPLGDRERGIVVPLSLRRSPWVATGTTNDTSLDGRGLQAIGRSDTRATIHAAHLKRLSTINVLELSTTSAYYWQGKINVGDHPFRVTFDICSGDLVLPGSGNAAAKKAGKSLYEPPKGQRSKGVFSGSLAGSGTTRGNIFTDVVRIGTLTANEQAIAVADTLEAVFTLPDFSPADGFLGLGTKSLTKIKSPPLLQNLYNSGQISQLMFGVLLRSRETCYSELSLGFSNQLLYQGPLVFANVIDLALWRVKMKVTVSGQPGVELRSMYADFSTNTTRILGDMASVTKFYKPVPDAVPETFNVAGKRVLTGRWRVPCQRALPDITFTFGDVGPGFAFPPDALRDRWSSNECWGTVEGSTGVLPNVWVVGTLFLQSFYAVFDANPQRPRVGFASVSAGVRNERC